MWSVSHFKEDFVSPVLLVLIKLGCVHGWNEQRNENQRQLKGWLCDMIASFTPGGTSMPAENNVSVINKLQTNYRYTQKFDGSRISNILINWVYLTYVYCGKIKEKLTKGQPICWYPLRQPYIVWLQPLLFYSTLNFWAYELKQTQVYTRMNPNFVFNTCHMETHKMAINLTNTIKSSLKHPIYAYLKATTSFIY